VVEAAAYPAWSEYPLAGMRLLSFIGIAVHWIILQYVLGLPFFTFLALIQYIRTGDQVWMRLARTLAKGFIVVFAVGAATGTGSEFGLVLLWPNLTEAAGRYIYFPLYAEIFAFMMEVVFLYLLWYGWNRLPVKALAAVAFLGFLGAWYSASMIVSVNSFMVAPTGVVPAVQVEGGKLVYMYNQGYPKLTIAVPQEILELLDVNKLLAAGVEVVTDQAGQPATAKISLAGYETTAVIVRMPVRIVQQLVREAYTGVQLKDSVLVKAGVLDPAAVEQKLAAMFAQDPQKAREYLERLVAMTRAETYLAAAGAAFAAQQPDAKAIVAALAQLPVKNVLDPIVLATVKAVGPLTITFKSPVFPASIAHVLGAGLVVSAFTAMAGFAMRLLRAGEGVDPEYRRYLETGFRFTAVLAAVLIAYQGFISGHEMGVAVAHYNPEKFAAMEGTAEGFTSIPKLLRAEGLVEKMMSMLAYGDPNVGLPRYDKIPGDYCRCSVTGLPDYDCRPPLILHYIYYTKVGLGFLMGLYGLVMALVAMRDRWGWADRLLRLVRIEGRPRWLLSLALLFAVISQVVSNMGWAVREIGRKPWTIYGMMTVDVAGTTNPLAHLASSLALVAIYYIAILAVLVYAVWRILWLPGKKAMGQA